MPPADQDSGGDLGCQLRTTAEEALRRGDRPAQRLGAEQSDRLIHELQVHQIELELQNEELRSAQQDLEAARDRYADLYDFAPVAYFTVGAKGLIEEANLTAATLLGRERGALLGTPFSAHVGNTPEDQDTYYRHRKQALASGDTRVCELRLGGQDGELFHARLESRARVSADGGGDGLRVVAVDISERKRAEAALRRAHDAAQAADRAKTEFLTNMSHEVRTPLSGVLGMVEVLSGTPLSPEQLECVEDIRLSGKLLLGIVNDVLDLSRIEATGVSLEAVEFALRAVVEDTVHLHAEAAHAKGLHLCCLLGARVPTRVVGDPGRLRQILSNLVGNAVKFTRAGQVVVRAELAEEGDAVPLLRVTVEDTGIGIPPHAQRYVFENFIQADAASNRHHGGTGLGLPICRRLARAMGGEIGLRSTVGEGSTFWFTCPLSVARSAPVVASFEGVRALVAEPHPTSRAFLLEQLAHVGVDASAAADRDEGLRLVDRAAQEGRPFRLALVDLELPGGGGMDLVRALRTHPGVVGLQAILLATFTARGLARETGAEHGHCHILKPVRERELIRCLQELLAGVEQPLGTVRGSAPPSHVSPRGRVLLAEDTPVNQKVMVELLRRQGYQTEVVADGAAAVAAALARPYDLVIMDWQMPGMDGLAATREIRRRSGPNQRVPIVALTAHALAEHRAECQAAGMDDYLCKPVEPLELRRVLNRWGKGTPPADTLGPAADTETGGASGDASRRLEAFRRRFSPDVAAKLSETILDSVPRLLSDLQAALAAGNAREVSARAHALRGSCIILGTGRACDLLKTIERRGEQADLADSGPLVATVAADLEQVLAILETWTAAGEDGGP